MASRASQSKSHSFLLKGGEFLLTSEGVSSVFIPEEFSQEQRLMAATCRDFVEKEILARRKAVEAGPEMAPKLLKKAADLGLLGVTVPTEYGGLGLDFLHSLLVVEAIGINASFATTYGAHTGIGTLPIVYYGTEAQKKRYLPDIIAARKCSCYCLTEPEAGSDANAGKTTAKPSEDGSHYLLIGQKMWISNAGFADIFIVFAKVEQDKNLSAFIVERSFGGITMGEEEPKMGLHGSSTRQVFFTDCRVPADNMLAERGAGFKMALNILNAGRIKLAAFVLSGAKHAITQTLGYASERKQFGQKLSSFGAVQTKIAEMITSVYACESATYRAGATISRAIDVHKRSLADGAAKLKGTEEYAIECAMMKVYASEVMDTVVDHAVQVHGGMGFSEELPIAAAYRDSRVTRIYEGANEINRLLVVGMLIKRATSGVLPLMQRVEAVVKESLLPPTTGHNGATGDLAREERLIDALKKLALVLAGKMVEQYGQKLEAQQELLLHVADIVTEIYVAESTLLRVKKQGTQASHAAELSAILRLCLSRAVRIVQRAGHEIIAFLRLSTEEENILLMLLRRYTKYPPVDVIRLGRKLAALAIDRKSYPFPTY